MLASGFFKILATEELENKYNISIEINSKHEIFKGHFPDNPVVPGVCMLQILNDILSEKHNKDLLLKESKLIKFTQIINPETVSQLHFQIQETETEQGLKVQAQLNSVAGNHFKFSGIYTNS